MQEDQYNCTGFILKMNPTIQKLHLNLKNKSLSFSKKMLTSKFCVTIEKLRILSISFSSLILF